MKKKRLITIFIVFFICFNLTNNFLIKNISAQENEEDAIPEKPRGLLQLFGFTASKLQPIVQLLIVAGAADPSKIEIGYNETVNFDVGIWDLEGDGFKFFTEEDVKMDVTDDRFLKFEILEYPGGNEFGKWKVSFDPSYVEVKEGASLKTNVSVSLRSPRLAEKAIKSGVLKIRIIDTYVFGNVWRPPEGHPLDQPFMRSLWTFLGLVGGWGKFSGRVLPEYLDVNILVKVKPVHEVSFDSVKYYSFEPDQIASIPITIKNLGNYKDTYRFSVVSENEDITVANPISKTLAPGEEEDTYLGVYIPPSVFDYGTIHNIKIEAYSINQPNVTLADRTVTLESKGIYLSEISIFGMILFFSTFIVIIVLLVFLFKNRKNTIFAKFDKKKKKTKEKKYLKNLKEKLKKPKKTKEKKQEKEKLESLFKREIKPKDKPEKKIKKEKIEMKKEPEPLEILRSGENKKQRVLKRIKKKQDKQKKKLGNIGKNQGDKNVDII